MENRQITEWEGYKKIGFTIDGRESFIVCPETPAEGNPWVWRCEFFGAFDYADRELLRQGWHLAYHKVSDMYGCPQSIEMLHAFYTEVCAEFALSPRPVLFGFSRGGLYAVNYAVTYPREVGALYLDAPVLDIRSWPCSTEADETCRTDCMRLYGLTEDTLADFHDNPLDKVDRVVSEKIPVLIVAGGADTLVPWDRNGKIFAERMQAAGGTIEYILKPDCGHHPHSLENPEPIVRFLGRYAL